MENSHACAENRPKSFREIRYEEKRQAIIRSAAKAFGQKGFHAATIEEITSELKMTKGSLYYYFSTKEELLYEAHRISLGPLLEGIMEIQASGAPPAERIRAAIDQYLHVLAEDFAGAFMLEYELHLPPEYRDEVLDLRGRYEELFADIIQDGVDSGRFRSRNPRTAAYAILGGINWFLRWHLAAGEYSLDGIVDACMDLYLNGLLHGEVVANS